MKLNSITKVSIEQIKEFINEYRETSKHEFITSFRYLVDILKKGIWYVWVEEENNRSVISNKKPQGNWKRLKYGSRLECEAYCRKKRINFEIIHL